MTSEHTQECNMWAAKQVTEIVTDLLNRESIVLTKESYKLFTFDAVLRNADAVFISIEFIKNPIENEEELKEFNKKVSGVLECWSPDSDKTESQDTKETGDND